MRIENERLVNSMMRTRECLNQSVLIQEKISGQEYGLDVINDLKGNFMSTCVKIKYAMRSGETDCAFTVEDAYAQKLGEDLGRLLRHVGNLDVDILVKDQMYYVLEMNARFGGGYPFSHLAGVNLPLAIVKWLKGEQIDKSLLQAKAFIMGQKDIHPVQLQSAQLARQGQRGHK